VSLNATGVAIVQSWIDDLVPNYGFVIRAINTEDDIKIRTSEYQIEGRRPLLELTTEESVAAPQGTNNSPIVWSTHTSKCLDVSAGGTANGTNILLWDCNASNANQKFNYDPQTEQIIWATHTNKCLDVRAGGTANGTNIQLWDCNASNANQKFNM
jgi:WD40 repeat protein